MLVIQRVRSLFLINNSDIIVIGMQEFVSLSIITAVLGPGKDKLARWEYIISTWLPKIYPKEKYTKIDCHIMMGICTLIYSKAEISDKIYNIQKTKVKTGFQGVGENKGAVVIR